MHEEHVATLNLLARMAQAIRAPRSARDAAMLRFRDLLRALLGHVRRTLSENPVEEEWLEFGRLAMALIETKRAHMQREESEMVPALRALLQLA